MKFISGKDFSIHNQTALTIGNFDGLHIGHRKLIALVKEYAGQYSLSSAVLSFAPHPVSVLTNNKCFQTITSPEEKIFLLQSIGIDFFIEYPFDKDFAKMEAEYFVEEILFKRLKCKVLVIGKGYLFGKDKNGSYDMLRVVGRKNNVLVIGCDHEEEQGEKISSTSIRNLIAGKQFDLIEKWMTVPYFIMGRVLHGKKLGRTIGFPTINIIPYKNKILPPNGIYFTKTCFNNKQYYSVTNIGSNPTVGGKSIIIETFIFNFDIDIYGKTVRIDFYDFVRDEMKFQSVDELKNRIQKDIALARDYFGL